MLMTSDLKSLSSFIGMAANVGVVYEKSSNHLWL